MIVAGSGLDARVVSCDPTGVGKAQPVNLQNVFGVQVVVPDLVAGTRTGLDHLHGVSTAAARIGQALPQDY